MTTRPQVNVFAPGSSAPSGNTLPLPAVFKAPIRPDIVNRVHTAVAKNKRQPYAVNAKAGHQTSAESWGTGRAVARIPRVGGGGTHRSGQAAFGNMCRGGRRFAPTKTWRKWHVKINLNEKRYATVSAIAATAVPSLVMARGHRIQSVLEVPLVIEDSHFTSLVKTKDAVTLLRGVNAYPDIDKVSASKKLRAGRGKMRNRRHRQRLGPLIIHDSPDSNIVRCFRNIPGVETANVNSLNLLQLAPGGHLGRFVVWTAGAFKKLDVLYGNEAGVVSVSKSNYVLPWNVITQPDIARAINSDEVQSVLKPKGAKVTKRSQTLKKNPLHNRQVLLRLNPYAKAFKAQGKIAGKKEKSASEKFLSTLTAQ